ncbi:MULTISPECIES: hypothetical protein [Methylobacteriaceae]|uniref:hypothetical protein n=1 Tax=Methylobacteriaceae TaxID=119045 RepID=UPI000CDA7089|nr:MULTISPECIES: hypothetical protein [Methylobacteriaceae]MCP1553991.1 hypothetical protein [Methylorubrum extorquens]POR41050.1 hypothetical protein CRT23_20665 [Methylobacterium sp. V23]
MRPDRQLVRLMAAMIVMIIAYVAPSAVQAHEGHHHGGHDHAAMTRAAKASVAPLAAPAPRDVGRSAAAVDATPVLLKAAVPARVAILQSEDAGRGCCPGPCKGTCCGTMSCCVPGILSAPMTMPTLAFGHVVLVTHDVDGRSGLGPEALPRPPRTLA